MEDPEQKMSAALLFVSRFDDFFDHGVYPAAAFGFMLAWIWIGLTEGYPIFMDGDIDLPSVVILLCVFAATLLAAGFLRALDVVVSSPSIWLGLAVLACTTCLFLFALYCGLIPIDEGLALAVTRFAMAILGVSAGVLVLCCAVGYACLRPASAG